MAEDLKIVASQFRKLRSKDLQHTFKFHSQQWRTWAACFIQAAWRRYHRIKHERALCDAENRLQYALANEARGLESIDGTMQRLKGTCNTRVLQLLPSKLVKPNFNVEGDNIAQEPATHAVVTGPGTSQTSIGHPPNIVDIVRTEIRAALAEHRLGLLEDMERIIMLILTRSTDMEGRKTAIEVIRTRGL
ncbi:hypothetical protein I3842_01G086300 [Carya illinoinensis]|uniref:Uncharacterized protein n=1 Tax=Carya illinoinensis TaxID=32201 RepID=A0A922K2R9_CARIL|nr:hypothetical protein I3842_01G086300 [Carya illinoinensis]